MATYAVRTEMVQPPVDIALPEREANSRAPFWGVLAQPYRFCHHDWSDQSDTWPEAQRLTTRALTAPSALAELFARDRNHFNATLLGAGLNWYSPAIRRIVSGRDRSHLASFLGSEVLALVVNLDSQRLVPGNSAASDVSGLMQDGLKSVHLAGLALLAGCTQFFGSGWSHCLKVRVAMEYESVIDSTVPLSADAAGQRLNWFSNQLSAFTEQQAIRDLTDRFNDESSTN